MAMHERNVKGLGRCKFRPAGVQKKSIVILTIITIMTITTVQKTLQVGRLLNHLWDTFRQIEILVDSYKKERKKEKRTGREKGKKEQSKEAVEDID